MAKGLYDYDPNTGEEIRLRQGDLVKVYEKVDQDWWFVKIENEVGLVPATYVEAEVESLPIPKGAGHQRDISGEHQKELLMSALDGLGFARKSDVQTPSGMIYGPDDATYYPVTAIDKKKKKNAEKGLLGISLVDKTVYFLEPITKEIVYKFSVAEIKSYKEKKSKLVIELESGDSRDFEGEKNDVTALFGKLEGIFKPKAANISNGNKRIDFPNDIPAPKAAAVILPHSPPHGNARAANPKAIAIYDYDANNQEELTIKEDDKLIVLDDSDPDWTLVQLENDHAQGLVPRTYIQVFND